jgi:hypothetical protein
VERVVDRYPYMTRNRYDDEITYCTEYVEMDGWAYIDGSWCIFVGFNCGSDRVGVGLGCRALSKRKGIRGVGKHKANPIASGREPTLAPSAPMPPKATATTISWRRSGSVCRLSGTEVVASPQLGLWRPRRRRVPAGWSPNSPRYRTDACDPVKQVRRPRGSMPA